jgi:hypothetical protein
MTPISVDLEKRQAVKSVYLSVENYTGAVGRYPF